MKIELNALPGLEKVASGYIWDTSENFLYSNKIGTMIVLSGNVQNGIRRYTVQLKSIHRGFRKQALNLRKDVIQQKVKEYLTSANKVGTNESVPKEKSALQGWIIGSIVSGALNVATNPKVHTTEASANTEIERLAKINVGRAFVKMKIEGVCVAGGVRWL